MPDISEERVVADITKILVEKYDIPKERVAPEGNFRNDYGLDSLDFISLSAELEELYDLTTGFENASALRQVVNIRDLAGYIVRRVAEKAA